MIPLRSTAGLPPLMTLPRGPLDTPLLGQLLRRAVGGEAARVLRLSEQRLRMLTGALADGPAGVHFVRAVALQALGRGQQVVEAGTMTVTAAERDGENGWLAGGRALRARQRVVLGAHDTEVYDADAVLRDLVRADAAIGDGAGEGVDPLVASIAHTSIGAGFASLRLYELAVPHHEAALALSCQDVAGWGGSPLWSGNLTVLHLTWALELHRVGQEREVRVQTGAAGKRAAETARLARRAGDPRWLGAAELFAACARAGGPEPGPAARRIGAGIEDLLADDLRDEAELVWPFHAHALNHAGQASEAFAVIERATRSLRPESDWRSSAAIAHTHAQLLANGGSSDAADALDYGERLAQALWRERLRTLHTARTLHEFERLRTESAAISRSASTDALTGVLNRRGFEERLGRLAATAPDRPVAVLAIDLDKFKQINDTRGHAAGDLALQRIAAALNGEIRTQDTVARLGGDEFGVLLLGSPVEAASRVAERIVAAVDAVPDCSATVSVGVAVRLGRDVRLALAAADEAMYVAKRGGGARFHLSSAGCG